jgi:hypothetical protein
MYSIVLFPQKLLKDRKKGEIQEKVGFFGKFMYNTTTKDVF